MSTAAAGGACPARPRERSWTRPALAALGSCAALIAQVLWLASLPYSTSLIKAAAPQDVLAAPSPQFHFGSLEWDTNALALAPELGEHREFFRRQCGYKSGVEAAMCVSDAMAVAFPDGVPTDEFVRHAFDPSAHLRDHLGGAPGHCMTRSAILAAALLSVGLPGRVVQVAPDDLAWGHTLVEVWDAQDGWVLVDPTWGGVHGDAEGPAPAVRLLDAPTSVRWFGLGIRPVTGDPTAERQAAGPPPVRFQGRLLYPEPWTYLRTGRRIATWPFRAVFVRVGPGAIAFGPAQATLRFTIPATALGVLAGFAIAAARAFGGGALT